MTGHSKDRAWTSTTGVITQIRPEYQWRDDALLHQGTVIQTRTPVHPDNSGGPLLDAQARLIGVNVFSAIEAQGVNYAVAVDTVRAFLQNLVSPPSHPAPRSSPFLSPSPVTNPIFLDPGASAYRIERFGQQIVGVYVNARVPPLDVWLVYRDPSRQHLAYAAKGSKTLAQIDTVVVGADPQWRTLVYYLDTNCDGIVDLIGYDTEGNGHLERYGTPPQPERLAQLARELVAALTAGLVSYSQIQICQ